MNQENNYLNSKSFKSAEPIFTDLNVIRVNHKRTFKSLLDKEISAIKFLKIISLVSLIGLAIIVSTNVLIDIYGLFLPTAGKKLPIYNNERVSKYLLSYRYIPENFDAAIIGTSLSANLDVAPYNKTSSKYQIYNASIMGANISEITPVAENLVKGGVNNIIICFSPYMTKNSGSKEVDLNIKLYYGALGSKNLYETYLVALIRKFELLPNKYPKNQVDEYGVNHYENLFKVGNVKEKIQKVIEGTKNEKLAIDPIALKELQNLIQLLNDKKVNYIGYFHPIPREVFEDKHEDYINFERTVRGLVNDNNKLIDFNTSNYNWFTSDYSNYIDHGHLSNKGQVTILTTLLEKFEIAK
jgi:hypothetical protein